MIELFHVSMRYAGADRPALDDVTLEIRKGEFCLLAGPSGAGKTSLLRLLFCAEAATGGQVFVGGRNLARLKPARIPEVRRNIGVVFQDFKLLPGRSVLDNVALAIEVQGRRREEVRERAVGVLKQVGLGHKLHQHAERLSGGEQQRVAIARALVVEPALLLCDEPTGNLDAERAQGILELLVTAHVRGTTVVVATHDPALLGGNRRVVRLEDGRVVADVPAYSPMSAALLDAARKVA
ncbi:MAG: ATP-binding cassette domain-containing protein [Deltaproteobacteria bacterium]|nr:ATP-binding cassette domain-containing protein [Deltaproteobacteria bacterium]